MRALRFMVCGGIIAGSTGFAVGFFGPIVFAPEANQGPLLGIFVTGPLGLIFGALTGLVLSILPSRKPPVTQGKPGAHGSA
jgi:hypothetical protein